MLFFVKFVCGIVYSRSNENKTKRSNEIVTHRALFTLRTVNPVDAIYGIIKEMAGDASNVK